jgi:hypothetical protein
MLGGGDFVETHELIRILEQDQQVDGSFLSYSMPPGRRLDKDAGAHTTTFMVSVILGALANVKDRRLEQVRERAITWLLKQPGPQWAFNYWPREAPERATRSYPDDWDDTSCAVIALTLARPRAVTGEVLGHIVTMLTNTEVAEGGPYRTWIVPDDAPKHWHDVDLAVNANIAYMLQLHGVDLPHLTQLVDERIAADEVRSPYYVDPVMIEYFLARWYRGGQQERLLERILARRQGERWGTALETAASVTAALNLGAEPAAVAGAVMWLRGLGGVEAEAAWVDLAIKDNERVMGSRALTAALVLEAAAKFEAAAKDESGTAAAGGTARGEHNVAERIHEQVVMRSMARLTEPGGEIAAAARRLHDRLLGGAAGGQITLLPYLFRQALGEHGRGIDDERVVALGMISFYGWVAYTVYDDFLDEDGEPVLLPMANVAMRELVLAVQREDARTPGFGAAAWPVLDRQEAANAWEVAHCRVGRQGELLRVAAPDFGDRRVLADRSMGHGLGCLAIMLGLGQGAGSAETRALEAFFHHFLIARQLGDDASDWRADLRKGQINAVGAHLLGGPRQRGGSVRELYERLDRRFWEQGLTDVNAWTQRELDAARAALGRARLVARPAGLETALLRPIEEAMRQAQDQQRQAAEFVRAYRPGG